MKVKCLTRVRVDGDRYRPGDVITGLEEKQIDRLINSGAAELVIEEEPQEPERAPDQTPEGVGPLTELTVAELRELAKRKGIEGYSGMKKDELIAALEADNDGGSGRGE